MSVVIPKEFFSVLESSGKLEYYTKKSKIFTQGDTAANFYIVVKGRVRVFSISANGKERTLEILEEGRIFGDSSFLANSRRNVTIEAVTDCCVISCRAEDIITMCTQSQQLMRLIFQHMTDTCNYLTSQILLNNNYNSTQKVCAFLLSESANRNKISIPYTHDEIAASVALNRVTVSRIISQLKEQQIISVNYGTVEILDAERLKRLLPDS